MKKFLSLILFILLIVSPVWGANYYVRPITGEYGEENGSDYANAYDGFAGINWGTVTGENTLFVAGTFVERLLIGSSGTDGTHKLQILSCTIANGASVDDPWIIDGASISNYQGAVQATSKNYLTIDGAIIQNTTGVSGEQYGVRLYAGLGNTIRNCFIKTNVRGEGIYVDSDPGQEDVDDLLIEFNDITGNGKNGLLLGNVKTTATIRYNNFNGNGAIVGDGNCVAGDPAHSNYHNIYIGHVQNGGTSYVYGNRLEDDICGQGIKIKNNTEVYNNYINGNSLVGIMHIEYAGVTATQIAHHNVIIEHPYFGIQILAEGDGTLTVNDYNNSIYSTTVGHAWTSGIEFEINVGTLDTYVGKNNIIYAPATRDCWRSAANSIPTSTTIENNWCYGPSDDPIVWGGTSRTWAYWQETLGFDSPNGGNSDPVYANPGSNDLTLQASSPCINTAEDLGVSYQTALMPSSPWTLQNPGIVQSSVVTGDQENYGLWDIGAFIYGNPIPVILAPSEHGGFGGGFRNP